MKQLEKSNLFMFIMVLLNGLYIAIVVMLYTLKMHSYGLNVYLGELFNIVVYLVLAAIISMVIQVMYTNKLKEDKVSINSKLGSLLMMHLPSFAVFVFLTFTVSSMVIFID